jgi:phytoene dehydrogenase-like protein
LDQKYDAVVIGAGLGGLSAAAALAQRDLSVLCLEKHHVPGGYAGTFVRGRYEFEIALHELSGMGTAEHPGALHGMLDELGMLDDLEFIAIPEVYRAIFPEIDVTLPVGWEPYEQTLCEAFPDQHKGIRKFMGRIHALQDEVRFFNDINLLDGLPSLGQLLQLPFKSRIIARYGQAMFGTILDRDISDPTLKAVIGQLWGYVGQPPSRGSFLLLGACMGTYVANGPQYIKGRSAALAAAFVRAIERRGGEVRLGCGVTELKVDGRKVTGVVTEQGEEIAAGTIISNLDPSSTCRDLIGVDKVPQKYWRKLQQCVVGPGSFNIYMGLAKPPEELGLTEHEVFVNSNTDIESQYVECRDLPRLFDPRPPAAPCVAMTCYNHADPDISPPGTSQVSMTTLMFGRRWHDVPPEDYVDVKNRVARSMIERVETVFPDLRSAAEVLEIATPVTNMRYTNQVDGAIYGYEQLPYNSTVYRLAHDGPFEGLYFAGAFTTPGGGFELVMTSGYMAAVKAARAAKKRGA